VETPFWVLAIVNFDVDFFKPDCLNTPNTRVWSFGHSLFLQLGLPIIVGLYCCALYGVSCLIISLRERKERMGSLPGAPQVVSSLFCGVEWITRKSGALAVGTSVGSTAVRIIGVATKREELELHFDNSISAFTSFLNVVYHTMTAKCLETFICNTLPYGSKFMASGETLLPSQSAHPLHVIASFCHGHLSSLVSRPAS
jgi:hypothetical protein